MTTCQNRKLQPEGKSILDKFTRISRLAKGVKAASVSYIKKLLYSGGGYRIFNLSVPFFERRPGDRPAIFVDISNLVEYDLKTGIQRVVRNIIPEFHALKSPSCLIVPVYTDIRRPSYYAAEMRVSPQGAQFIKTNNKIRLRSGDTFLAIDYAPNIILSKIACLKQMRRMGVALNFIVYDLIPVHHPEWFGQGADLPQKAWLKYCARLGKFIAISRSVKNDLEQWLKERKITPAVSPAWFHLGNSTRELALPENTRRLLPNCPAFMIVSTIEPRKGHSQALAAFKELWRAGDDVCLVFVGKHGWKMEDFCGAIVRDEEFNKRFFWFDGCSDAVLAQLYNEADCVLLPSREEGFGLAIVEGATFGKPLLLRDLPVFREIAGDNAIYFRGEDAADLAEAIREWLRLRAAGALPDSRGIKPISWRESAEQLLQAMEPEKLAGHDMP